MNIPTIYQKLFHRGTELADNDSTVQALDIFANDTLEVCEVTPPDEEDFGSDIDVVDAPKPRKEGRAFGGTLLAGEGSIVKSRTSPAAEKEAKHPESEHMDDITVPAPSTNTSSGDEIKIDAPSEDVGVGEVICSACTLANPVEAICCEVCDTPF